MNDSLKNYKRTCILLSGGVGARMGASTPKQYIQVKEKPIIEYTLQTVSAWKSMDSLIIVADKDWHSYLEKLVLSVLNENEHFFQFLGFAEPGKNRQLSIFNAMNMLRDYLSEDAIVMIHDGVRPCLSTSLLERCDTELDKGSCDGVMPYLEVKDTIYLKDIEDKISGMLDREALVAGQTPEFFDYWKYLKANEILSDDEMMTIHGSTEPAVKAGMKITLVPGDEGNFKITTPEDLEKFQALVYK